MKLFIPQVITLIVGVGSVGVILKTVKTEPVVIVKDLRNGHNVVGEKMELKCQTTFYAKYVSIEWKTPKHDVYKNVSLEEKTNSSYVTTSILVVEEAGIEHSGLYICEIIHKQLKYKLATRNISITVYDEEEHIIRINTNFLNIIDKAYAEIEIEIKAHPHVSVDWIKDGQEIIKNLSKTVVSLTQTYDGEYNYKSKLTFNHITDDDQGVYTIIVNNGIEKSNRSVEIYLPKENNVDLSLVSVNEEEMTAVYQCSALGIFKPNVTWMFQPCEIPRCMDDDDDSEYSSTGKRIRNFDYEDRGLQVVSYVSVNLTDFGILKCVTQNSEAVKTIFHTHNQFKYFVEDEGNLCDKRLEVGNRQFVNILYSWSLYKYIGKVFWYHNGEIINKEKSPFFETVEQTLSDTSLARLTFRFVREQQLGNFTCQILTRTGKIESKTIEVVSKNMSSLFPKISFQDLNGGHTTVGQDIRLVCNVTSYRREKISWWFVQKEHNKTLFHKFDYNSETWKTNKIVENNLYITVHYRTISPANISETGYYVCGLRHEKLLDSNYIWLKIYDVNETSLTFEKTNEFDVNNINIKVLITAHPPPKIKWLDNHDKEIVFGHQTSNFSLSLNQILDRRENKANYEVTLTFNSIDTNNFGNYTVLAENKNGTISCSTQVNATGKPSGKIDVYSVSAKNVTVKCSSTAYPEPEIKWYFKNCTTLKNCLDTSFKIFTFTNEFLPLNELWNEKNGLQIISYVSVNLSERGVLVCRSANSFGEKYSYEPVLGTGFEMSVETANYVKYSNKTIQVVGERYLNVTCAVSSPEYIHEFQFLGSFGRSKSNDFTFIGRKTQWDFLLSSFLEATITFPFDDHCFYFCTVLRDGFLKSQTIHIEYRCKLETFNSEYIFRNFDIDSLILAKADVCQTITKCLNASAYVNISKTNLGNTSLEVDVISKWTFYCYIEGFPTPNLTWYKNDQVIKDSDKFKFANNGQVLEIANVFPEDEGMYKCRAYNDYSEITKYISLNIVVSNTWLYVQLILLLCAAIFIAILTLLKFQKYRKVHKKLRSFGLFYSQENSLHRINPNLSIEDQAALLPFDQKWEIPFEKITIGKQLGSGAFGVTFQATVVNHFPDDPVKTVAVKTVNEAFGIECIRTLISELKILSHLGSHLNIVNFLGACTRRLLKDELYIVLQYCSFGNLLDYIKKHSENFIDYKDYDSDVFNWNTDDAKNSDNKISVSSINFLVWAFQIARGMEYLGYRRVVHGDLAARNVLLTDGNVVKVCDFGLAKTVYNYGNYIKKSQGPLPIKWMAVEAIQKGIFSTQSDVWSFGVVLWEIFSLGKTPYCGLTVDENFCKKLIDGYRMEQPETATSKIYKLMLDCWQLDPLLRPSFSELGERIGSFLEDPVKNYYISMNNGYVLTNKKQFDKDSDYLAMVRPPTYQNMISK